MSSSESVPDLTPEKTAILVELQALSHTVAEVSKSLDELLQLTSPGGPLHDKQQKAIASLSCWEALVKQR